MNNRNFRTLGAVLCASAILFNPSMLFAESPQKGNQAWSQRMQALSKNLSELLPDLSSHERFTDKKNRARIEKNVKALGELAHSIGKKGDTRPVDADPTLRFVAELFEQEMDKDFQSSRIHWS